MQPRRPVAALATVALALGVAGCAPRQVSDVPPDDRPTPETTPFLEPASPPANPSDRFPGEDPELDEQ